MLKGGTSSKQNTITSFSSLNNLTDLDKMPDKSEVKIFFVDHNDFEEFLNGIQNNLALYQFLIMSRTPNSRYKNTVFEEEITRGDFNTGKVVFDKTKNKVTKYLTNYSQFFNCITKKIYMNKIKIFQLKVM